ILQRQITATVTARRETYRDALPIRSAEGQARILTKRRCYGHRRSSDRNRAGNVRRHVVELHGLAAKVDRGMLCPQRVRPRRRQRLRVDEAWIAVRTDSHEGLIR